MYSWPSLSIADVKSFWLRNPLLSAYMLKMQGMKTLPDRSAFCSRSAMETLPLPFARRENLHKSHTVIGSSTDSYDNWVSHITINVLLQKLTLETIYNTITQTLTSDRAYRHQFVFNCENLCGLCLHNEICTCCERRTLHLLCMRSRSFLDITPS